MNPLIFFIVVVILDVFLKSAKDKKKIEEARKKRAKQIQDRTSKGRSIIDTFNDEIEKNHSRVPKGINKDLNNLRELEKSVVGSREYTFNDSFNESKISDNSRSQIKEKEFKNIINKNDNQDLRKDILKGIIFSEILSEPKSIQNMKRSM